MSVVNSTAGDVDVDLARLFQSLVRRWAWILGVAAVAAGAAFLVASMATPQYRSETRVLIETRESVFTRPERGPVDDRNLLDEEGVTSQVEVISSTDILKKVAKDLNLARLSEFDDTVDMSLASRLLIVAGLKADPNEVPAEERVLKAMREKLAVYRVEKSRVIVITFSSQDPKLAADVPNAIADAYLSFNRDAKLQSNSDATQWLEPEIASLTERVKKAEARVAEFRAQSDLPVGQNNAALSTQQLSEMSSELSRVRATRATAEANAERVRQAIASGGSLDAFPEILSSPLVQRLRERQVQLKADIADLSTTLLDNHPRIRGLRSQLADLELQIRSAAQTVLQGLLNEAKATQAREEQLVGDLNRLKVESSRVGEKEVELRALEREAAAQRDLLESYLVRFREAASRQDGNYLPADARVFSRAVTPLEAYFPKVVPIVSAAFVGTMLLMAIGVLLSELFSGRAMRPARPLPGPVEQISMPAHVVAGSEVNPRRDGPGMDPHAAALAIVDAQARRALVLSPEGDEAAASAVLVARDLADSGQRVLLLDLTASGAASLPTLEGRWKPGITNLLAGEAQFAEVIHSDIYSDCHVMPAGTADPVRAMRAIDRLPIILDSLGKAYDVVLVECGAATAESIQRLANAETVVLVSVIDAVDQADRLRDEIRSSGHGDALLVSPTADGGADAAPATRAA